MLGHCWNKIILQFNFYLEEDLGMLSIQLLLSDTMGAVLKRFYNVNFMLR